MLITFSFLGLRDDACTAQKGSGYCLMLDTISIFLWRNGETKETWKDSRFAGQGLNPGNTEYEAILLHCIITFGKLNQFGVFVQRHERISLNLNLNP
jgi:hypothetical protein